ncbi:hypothetical protein [Deinococcus sp.]|uniref:hypothetical protein n=1 Tax=Deinococcus sp. TaxID=47478 RepID=UPI0025B8E383|nr:hypothetical protein [Deinococcus sp.]
MNVLGLLLTLSLVVVGGLCWGWLSRDGPGWAGFALPLALLLDMVFCLLARRHRANPNVCKPPTRPRLMPKTTAHHLGLRALLDGGLLLFVL